MILIIFMYMILALSFVAAKNTIFYSTPLFLLTVRMIISGGALLGYQWVTGDRNNFSRALKDWWPFLTVAFLHIYVVFVLEFWALQYVSALKTVLIYSATPFATAFLSYLVLNERLTLYNITGILLGVIGLAPLLASQALAETGETLLSGVAPAFSLFGISIPEAALACAMLSAAYAWFHVKKLSEKNYSIVFVNGVAMLLGGVMCGVTFLFVDGVQATPVTAVAPFVGWLTLLILLSNVIFYNLYAFLIKRYSITFVSLSGFLCPVFSTIFEWLLMDGVITWHHLFCLVCVTTGLFVFYKES